MKNVKVIVETGLWANVYTQSKAKTLKLDMTLGATVADVLARLRIPPEEAGFTTINGQAAPREALLLDGGHIKIFPTITGG